jgi:hypothetical protein
MIENLAKKKAEALKPLPCSSIHLPGGKGRVTCTQRNYTTNKNEVERYFKMEKLWESRRKNIVGNPVILNLIQDLRLRIKSAMTREAKQIS